MENKSQISSEIEDNKNLNQKKETEYTLLNNLNNIGEEQKLLQSVNNPTLCQDNHSMTSSQCDQSIELISSNLEDSKVIKQQNHQEQSLKSANKFDSSEIVDRVKEYASFFVDLFKWKREYDSFNQLYFQIAFDSLLAFQFYEKQRKFFNQRNESKQEEKIANQMVQRLQKDHLSLYHASKQDENTVIYLEKTAQYKIEECKRNEIIDLYTSEGYLTVEVDKNYKYYDKAQFFKNTKNMDLLTKLTASTLSFLSGKLFKSKLSFYGSDEDGKFRYFLFGKKAILSNSKIGFHLKQQIQHLNLSKFKFDQIAYIISILVASGFCLYFAVKLAKNIMYLAKKKKLFRKKQ
ncbi:hypothetical protein ABPG72_005941 [Tetrahymena utriculariae]